MPFYKFKCDKCSEEIEKFWSIKSFDDNVTRTSGNTYLKELCSCGGEMRNQIGMIGLGPDIYKNDPNSNQFWKRGKSTTQIAGILSDDNSAPY